MTDGWTDMRGTSRSPDREDEAVVTETTVAKRGVSGGYRSVAVAIAVASAVLAAAMVVVGSSGEDSATVGESASSTVARAAAAAATEPAVDGPPVSTVARGTIRVLLQHGRPVNDQLIDNTATFTATTGIAVEYDVAAAPGARPGTAELVVGGRSLSVSTEGTGTNVTTPPEPYDVIALSGTDVVELGADGLLRELGALAVDDPVWQPDDLTPAVRSAVSVDDRVFGAPIGGGPVPPAGYSWPSVTALALPTTARQADLAWEYIRWATVEAAAGSGRTTAREQSEVASSDEPGADRGTITVVVQYPDQFDQRIIDATPGAFTAHTGITVEYIEIDPQTFREIITRGGGHGLDLARVVVQQGAFEVPQFGQNDWVYDLDALATPDPAWSADDLVPTVRTAFSADGVLYGAPLWVESSVIAYRPDLLDGAGVAIPAEPTWDDIATIARAVDGGDTAGICIEGAPTWDELGAAFTSVLHSFGGTWWAAGEDGERLGPSQVDQPSFRSALEFYAGLLADAGPTVGGASEPPSCADLYRSGEAALWFGPVSVAAGFTTADGGDAGATAFTVAPSGPAGSSAWLQGSALTIPMSVRGPNVDLAWEYVRWASSLDPLAHIVGAEQAPSWSTPWHLDHAALDVDVGVDGSLGPMARRSLASVVFQPEDGPARPGTPGAQYVGVPEFMDIATRCVERLDAVVAGTATVDETIEWCHEVASQAVEW